MQLRSDDSLADVHESLSSVLNGEVWGCKQRLLWVNCWRDTDITVRKVGSLRAVCCRWENGYKISD